jgi:opacity protein-like surface antigen
MTTTMINTKWLAVVCMIACTGVAQAGAQSAGGSYGSISVNLGGQFGSQTFSSVSTPAIYGETAQISVPYEVKSGLLFDISGTARVWRKLGVGLGYSRFSNTDQSTVTAQIPSPLFINSPRTATASTGDLSHTESAIHLLFSWPFALSPKFDVAVVVGPSFIKISQDLVSSITPVESGPPFSTVAIGSVALNSASEWATGVNAGVDLVYHVTPKIGAGVLLRYVGASADLDTGSGSTVSVDAGGTQLAAGIRYRF